MRHKSRSRVENAEKKRIEAQRQKEQRQEEAKTPEGRARSWLQGLQEHISKCDNEVTYCKADDCPLPAGLAKEYAAQWQSKCNSFKRARTMIEGVLKGTKDSKNFAKVVGTAENNVKDFKSDLQRYKVLCRSYEKRNKMGLVMLVVTMEAKTPEVN